MTRGRAFYLILILGFLIAVSLVYSLFKFNTTRERVAKIKREYADLKIQEEELLQREKEVESSTFIEKEARNKLGMSRPGERVIVISSSVQEDKTSQILNSQPNWKKWLYLIIDN